MENEFSETENQFVKTSNACAQASNVVVVPFAQIFLITQVKCCTLRSATPHSITLCFTILLC